MQLLPAVERFCKSELHEDCGDLRSLMLRFDDEQELLSHGLGRSLLLMLQDEDVGFENFTRRLQIVAPLNPFDDVRAGIAAVDLAFSGLRPQVLVVLRFYATCNLRVLFNEMFLGHAFFLVSLSSHPLSWSILSLGSPAKHSLRLHAIHS